MASGRKRFVLRYCRKEKKDITFIVQCSQVKELKKSYASLKATYRWDTIFLSETWRQDKSEIWETHHKHEFKGARKIR